MSVVGVFCSTCNWDDTIDALVLSMVSSINLGILSSAPCFTYVTELVGRTFALKMGRMDPVQVVVRGA